MADFDYNSARWKRLRKSVLRRDNYQCQRCKRYGRSKEAVEVHHVLFVEEYPEYGYSPENLVSLCHACHNAMHPEKADTMNSRRGMRRR